MNKRPLPVTVVAIVYIAAGVLGIAYHSREFKATLHPLTNVRRGLTAEFIYASPIEAPKVSIG